MAVRDLLAGRLPPDDELLMSSGTPKVPYVIKKQVLVSGGELVDAQPGFDQQRTGISAAESLDETKIGHYSAYRPALDAAWRVGRVVVEELVRGWAQYRNRQPGL